MSKQARLEEVKGSKSDNTGPQDQEKEKFDPIRIERDEFGELPVDWKYLPIDELKDYIESGCSASQNKDGNGISVSRIETIADGVVNYQKVGFVPEDRIDAEKYKLEKGNLLFSNINSREEIGKTAIYKAEKPLYHGMNLLRIGLSDKMNDYFGYYIFESEMGYRIFFRNSQAAVGQSSINQGQLKSINLPVPPIPEQRRIASVLYNVDQAIQKTEEIIEQTQRVKKGLMQDLFTEGYYDHEEFKQSKYGEIPVIWNIEKISEIAENIQAGGTPDTGKEEYYGGNIPWVKTGELKQDVITETEQTITKEGFENSAARKFPEGTVLVAMYGATTGATSRLGMEATTNQACCGIQVEDEKVDSYFLHQQLEYFKDNLTALSAGSGQQNIRKSIIVNFDVLVPPLNEQKKISDILRNIQKQINKQRESKEILQCLKKGLMQDLLTGEIRTDESVEVLDEVVEVEG